MNKLKELREKQGISQKFIAISLGVKAPSVHEWETGKSNPTVDNLIALADLLMVSVDELLGRAPAEALEEFTKDELRLIYDFRALNQQGKEYILQTMDMVKDKYKKTYIGIPDVEGQAANA